MQIFDRFSFDDTVSGWKAGEKMIHLARNEDKNDKQFSNGFKQTDFC